MFNKGGFLGFIDILAEQLISSLVQRGQLIMIEIRSIKVIEEPLKVFFKNFGFSINGLKGFKTGCVFFKLRSHGNEIMNDGLFKFAVTVGTIVDALGFGDAKIINDAT